MKPLERMSAKASYTIRRYQPKDRDAIRNLCCETGFLGKPIDEVFSDRKIFADYLTSYYTDWEPESVWVGEVDGEVVGYLTGCKRWNLNKIWSAAIVPTLLGRAATQFLRGKYDARDKKFLTWILLKAWREAPITPIQSAHFHFNARKEHRRLNMMRDLLVTLLDELRKAGVPRLYGQMSTYENKRTDQMFEYLGWKVIDKKQVSKYRDYIDKDIFLTTAVMELK